MSTLAVIGGGSLVGDFIIDHGIWGLVAALISIIVWLIQKLLVVLDKTNEIIRENTRALLSLDLHIDELREIQSSVRDNLLTRPCQLPKRTEG